jgi:hypothetical protein
MRTTRLPGNMPVLLDAGDNFHVRNMGLRVNPH